MHKYTLDQKEFIKDFAYGHSYVEITDAINKKFEIKLSINQVRAFLKSHKITTGRTERFEKGNIPFNKGLKGVGGWEPTQLKKGHVPMNHKEVGTESIRYNHKRGQMYIYVKVAEPNKWRMKHVLIWEQCNGPVPSGKVIIFLDRNQLNTDISNLTLIDRSINAILNQKGLRYENQEATKAAIGLAQYIEKYQV